jgi:hypothetical protein
MRQPQPASSQAVLTGHGWRTTRHILDVGKSEFDTLLELAIMKARSEERGIKDGANYGPAWC